MRNVSEAIFKEKLSEKINEKSLPIIKVQQLRKEYKKLSLIYHPDRAQKADKKTANENFKNLNNAYSELLEELKKDLDQIALDNYMSTLKEQVDKNKDDFTVLCNKSFNEEYFTYSNLINISNQILKVGFEINLNSTKSSLNEEQKNELFEIFYSPDSSSISYCQRRLESLLFVLINEDVYSYDLSTEKRRSYFTEYANTSSPIYTQFRFAELFLKDKKVKHSTDAQALSESTKDAFMCLMRIAMNSVLERNKNVRAIYDNLWKYRLKAYFLMTCIAIAALTTPVPSVVTALVILPIALCSYLYHKKQIGSYENAAKKILEEKQLKSTTPKERQELKEELLTMHNNYKTLLTSYSRHNQKQKSSTKTITRAIPYIDNR